MSYLDEFLQAAVAGDEAEAERLSYHLQPTDEAKLLAVLSGHDTDNANRDSDGDSDITWWAVRGLAHCGTVSAAPLLAALVDDPRAHTNSKQDASLLCATAALALGHLHQREPEAVHLHLPQIGGVLAHADGFVRQAAADALALCGDAAVPVLEQALTGENDGARARAAHALRKIGSLKVAPALFQHLNDPHYLVRLHAYEGLDEMGLLDNVILEV